jgi:methanogenic corrinoid protein MtbC1
MRKAFNKPASVMTAGTHPINTTYDNFHIIERDVPFQPDSMRISGFQSHMASRLNESRIQFTSEEIENAHQEIIQKIEGENNPKVTANQPKEIKGLAYN